MSRRNQSLLSRVRSIPQLRSAWFHLKKNPRSHGLSLETIEQFGANAENRLKTIQRVLRDPHFRFGPVRAKRIHQKDGEGKLKPRNLQIPDIPDRVILRSIVEVIEPILTPVFNLNNPASFAYIRKKGVRKAIARVIELYGEGNSYVLEADIKDFFPSIKHEQLLKKVYSALLPDKSINELIRQGIEQEVNLDEVEEKYWREFQESEVGIPLGGGLSPLLANVYLSSFDAQMLKAGFGLVRYADDFVVLGKTPEEVKRAYDLARRILEKELQLEMHPLGTQGKTQILSIRENEFRFLGVAFNGERLWPSKEKLQKFLASIDELGRVRPNFSVLILLTKMKNLVRGWIEAYNFTDISPYLPSIDQRIDRAIGNSACQMSWLPTPRLSQQQRLHSGVPFAVNYYEEARSHLKIEERRIFGLEFSAPTGDKTSPLSGHYLRQKNPQKSVRAWFDGVTEPINPGGTCAYGAVVQVNGKKAWEYFKVIGSGKGMTNNVGEYAGFLAVLNYLLAERLTDADIAVFGDSNLVINQMFGDWEIKDGHYAPMALEAKRLLKKFPRISGQWIPREKNQRADWLSKQALVKAGIQFRIQPLGV